MRLSNLGSAFNLLYNDRLSIYRRQEVTNADGTTGISNPATPLYSNISCRISFSTSDSPESNIDGRNPINLQIKVFCDPTVNVQKGDRLVVNRRNDDGVTVKTYSGTANLPLIYVTHQEILLVQRGDA